MMESIVPFIKYVFVIALGVETLLILRALYQLARDKAREAQASAPASEE
jgi:hypothetical protein